MPKNWVDLSVNKLRNGDRGLISVRINKMG